jgi:hypothetical protein
MSSLRDYSVAKAASTVTLDILRKGLMSKSSAFAALQAMADEVGMPGESPAQRFNKAFASGDRNRIANGNALLTAYGKLGTGGLPFRWEHQYGEMDPEGSVRRVTHQSDDRVRSNMEFLPYEIGPDARVITAANSDLDPLGAWNNAVTEKMKTGMSYSQAHDAAMKDEGNADLWAKAKSFRFSELRKTTHGWKGQPDKPHSAELDEHDDELDDDHYTPHQPRADVHPFHGDHDHEDEDDLHREGRRRRRLRKSDLPAIVAALKKHLRSGGGGGISR